MPDIWESECPVSSITQRSFDLVQLVNTLEGVKEATGSTIAADQMPGCVVDAIRVYQSASIAMENARIEALAQ